MQENIQLKPQKSKKPLKSILKKSKKSATTSTNSGSSKPKKTQHARIESSFKIDRDRVPLLPKKSTSKRKAKNVSRKNPKTLAQKFHKFIQTTEGYRLIVSLCVISVIIKFIYLYQKTSNFLEIKNQKFLKLQQQKASLQNLDTIYLRGQSSGNFNQADVNLGLLPEKIKLGPEGIGNLTPEMAAKLLPDNLNPYKANSQIINREIDAKTAFGMFAKNAQNLQKMANFGTENKRSTVDRRQLDETKPASGKDAFWKKKRITDTEINHRQLQEELVSWYSVPIQKFETCPGDLSEKVLPNQAKYQTDPSKFLTGALIWGPNNQLRGLREMVFLALKLNRTLIMPPFFKHYAMDESAEDKSSTINHKYRIDIEKLAELIPVNTISYANFQKMCHKNFDVIFAGRRDLCHADKPDRLWQVTDFFKFDEIKFQAKGGAYPENSFYCQNLTQELQPDNDRLKILQPNVKKQLLIPFDQEKIQKLFPSELPCAISLFVYKSFNLKTVMYDQETLDKRQPGHSGGFYQGW